MQRRFFFVFIVIAVVAVSAVVAAQSGQIYTYTQRLTIESDHPTVFGAPIDIDGDKAMIGAYFADNSNGAAYYYEQINGQWIEKQKLIASDAEEGDMLGLPLEMDGDHALVSALGAGQPTATFTVYAYERVNGVWVEKQKLPVPAHGDFATNGWIALRGNTAMVQYSRIGHGFITVYWYENGEWVATQTIEHPNITLDSYEFGRFLVLTDEIAWISDPKNTFIFGYEKINGLWTHTITLDDMLSMTDYNFWAEGDHLILLEYSSDGSQAVAYHRDNGVWTRQQTLPVADNVDPGIYARWDWVDGDRNRIVLGGGIGPRNSDSGEADEFFSVWEYQDDVWVEIQRTEVQTETTPDYFHEVYNSISDNTVMVLPFTSPLEDAVYVYTDPKWVPTATPTTPPPTLTNTPDAPPTLPPLTASPTPTHTPLPDDTVELLVNGGFESDLNGWKLKNPTKDKVKCDKPEKVIAFEGACVFQFKGGAGENSKLQQSVDLAVNPVSAGDTLTLDGAVWTKGNISSKVMVKVKYASRPPAKIVVNVAGAPAKQWTDFSAVQPSLSVPLADVPTAVKVQIKHSSASGKVRYDALSLTHQSNILPTLGLPQ